MKNIVLFTLFSFLLFACNKPIYDYRSKYVGTYHVIQYNQSYSMGQVFSYDTSYYDLKVERSDEIYYVNFISDGGETNYLLEKDGTLHKKSFSGSYFEGGFLSKSKFTLSGGYFSPGGGASYTSTGIKIK
jgi:hypothetical protein